VGVGDVAGEAVELGDGQDAAARPERGQGLVQAGTVGAAGAGEPAVDVDPLGRDTERGELLDLDVDVLFVGRAACVADTDVCPPAASRSTKTSYAE
jgi:hypothetical protein